MTPGRPLLSELERDAITELANIGVSRAAASLRKMVGQQVFLSVPSVDILSRRSAAALINERETDDLVAVQQAFSGPFSGRALLIFPQTKSLQLIRAVIGNSELPAHEAEEMEVEALAETGNVILNGCLGTIANMLRQSLRMSLPEVLRGSSTQLFQPDDPSGGEGLVLFLYINFSVRARDIRGYIAMLMDLPALDSMRVLVGEFIARYVPATKISTVNAANSFEELRRLAGPVFASMERAGVPMAVTDARLPDYPFVFLNEAFTRLAGYGLEEVVGRGWDILLGPESDPKIVAELEQAMRDGRQIEVVVLNHRKDGTVFRNKTFVSPIYDADGRYCFLLSTHENVPEAERTAVLVESRRKRREEVADRLRSTLSLAGGAAAWEWHINEGRIIGDARFADLYGIKPEDAAEGISADAYYSIIHPDDRTRIRLAIDGMLQGAGVFSKEYRIVLSNGSVRWVHARGHCQNDESDRPVGFIGVLVDVTDQKRVEEQLRIAQTAGGIGTFEHIDGFATATVSPQFCRLLGLHQSHHLPTRTINALVDPRDPPLIDTSKGPRAAPPNNVDLRITRPDNGEIRWLTRRGEYLHDAETAGLRFSGVIYDITHSKHSEQQLRSLNETLESRVQERTRERDGIWRLSHDLLGIADADGVWLSVNPAWTRILGWAPDEIVGKTSEWLEHADDRGKIAQRFKLTIEGQSLKNSLTHRIRHKDGSYRSIAWTIAGDQYLIYGTGRDVTTEIEQAEALERSQARIRSVFETSYQYQGLLTPDGVLLEANETALAGIHARLADVVGKEFWLTPWFTGTPGMSEQIKAAIPLIAAGQTLRQEIVVNLPSGNRAFDFSMRPVLNRAGKVIGIVPEAIELTERRIAEEQLRQSLKMQAVGQLTGGIAHDFNNMLAVVIAGLNLADRQLAKGEDASKFLQGALDAAHRAASLTNRLLAFSRQLPLAPQPVDANRLVMSMSELLRRTLGETTSLQTVLAEDLWKTNADSGQLESAILNLAINARDAMPDGGKLTIATANSHLDDDDVEKHPEIEPGEYIMIAVSDTGAGMPPDVIARAFDPFFTTKEIGKGTGLGLSQVYGFVKQSKGHLKITSEVGQGTAIKIYLPRLLGSELIGGDDHAQKATPTGSLSEVILVVEDDPRMRDMTVAALRELGFAVLPAASAAGALQILEDRPEIGLLFTDIVMPDMNGRRLAEEALKMRASLKVLFTTGYTPNAVGNNGPNGLFDRGVEFLAKPFTLDQLGRKVREVLSKGTVRPVGSHSKV